MRGPSVSSDSTLHVRPAALADLGTIREILDQAQLPVDDIAETWENLIVGERDARIVATAGVEVCGAAGLVRSVALRSEDRGQGLGTEIVRAVLHRAEMQGLTELYLLTTTAAPFFEAFGFRGIERDQAPPAIRRTREFSNLCPESAVLMCRAA